jgi:regulatory protein
MTPINPRGMAERPADPFEVGLAALRRRELTSAELTAWLGNRGFGTDEVETAIARLTEAGELDDERFARGYAEDKRELRGWGAKRIRETLRSRGITSRLLEQALEPDSHGAQVERARGLLVQRGQPLAEPPDRARALGFLTRRGYEHEIAYEAIRLAASVDPSTGAA